MKIQNEEAAALHQKGKELLKVLDETNKAIHETKERLRVIYTNCKHSWVEKQYWLYETYTCEICGKVEAGGLC